MKYKFYPQESRIVDFLNLPKCLHFNENSQKNMDTFKDILVDDYLDYMNKVEMKLKPFAKEIEVFYMSNFFNDYDFIDLISNVLTPLNYKDEKEYLEALKELDEETIRKYIIYSLIDVTEEHDVDKDEIMKQATELSKTPSSIVNFIKELSIDTSFKWNLFLIVEEPKVYMNRYIELMNKLLYMFDEIYHPIKDEVIKTGKHIEQYLNKNNKTGIKEITNGIIDDSFVKDDDNVILVSALFSYTLSIRTVIDNQYINWGLRIEEAVQKMKEFNENKIQERVQIFKNLGDKTRYEVLKLIASGVHTIKDIASTLDVSSATISYHINALITSRIISMNKQNKKMRYVVDFEFMNQAMNALKEDLQFPKNT